SDHSELRPSDPDRRIVRSRPGRRRAVRRLSFNPNWPNQAMKTVEEVIAGGFMCCASGAANAPRVRGGMWASNSNFPTWQMEGPAPKLIRVQPAVAPVPQREARVSELDICFVHSISSQPPRSTRKVQHTSAVKT